MSVFDEIQGESREQLIAHLLCVFVPLDPEATENARREIEKRRSEYLHNTGWDHMSTDDLRRMVYPFAA